jgi:hypothetical protein
MTGAKRPQRDARRQRPTQSCGAAPGCLRLPRGTAAAPGRASRAAPGRPPAPAGHAPGQAPTRGVTLLARPAPPREDAAPRGAAHPPARLGASAGAKLVPGQRRMVAPQLAEPAMGRLVPAWCSSSGMRRRGHGPTRTGLASHVLHARQTPPTHGRQRPLRAEPACIRLAELRTSVARIGSQTLKAQPVSSDDHVHTAVGPAAAGL